MFHESGRNVATTLSDFSENSLCLPRADIVWLLRGVGREKIRSGNSTAWQPSGAGKPRKSSETSTAPPGSRLRMKKMTFRLGGVMDRRRDDIINRSRGFRFALRHCIFA